MRSARIALHRVRSVLRRSRADQDLQREIEIHIEQLTKQGIESGLTEAEARQAARRDFGSVEQAKEQCRDMRQVNTVENMLQDARYGLRGLIRNPAFTAMAVLTLALGIGANSAIFSVINATLLRPLPYPKPSRLVLLFEKDALGPGSGPNPASFRNFADWEQQNRSFVSMSAGRGNDFDLGGEGSLPPERIQGAIYSFRLFKTLGVHPLIGRPFTAEEDRPGAPRVAIISYALWQQRFGATPDILHSKIRLDGFDYAIIGVMPPQFGFPVPAIQVWVPVEQILPKGSLEARDVHQLYVVARVRNGISITTATAEIAAIQHRIWSANRASIMGRGALSLPLRDITTIQSKTSLYVLLAAVGCLLLIACVNVSNLLLARGSQRSREFSLRAALGAGRSRLLQQTLIESVVLASIAAVVGLFVAYALTHALAAHAPVLIQADDIDTSSPVDIDWRVLGFTTVLSVLVGVAAGFFPALRAARNEVAAALKEGGRSATLGRNREKLRAGLVTAEFAVSLLLLIAAGLMIRSFFELQEVRPGVRIHNLLTAGVSLPNAHYRTPEQISNAARALLDRVKVLPGVTEAGLVNCLPLRGYCSDNTFDIVGHPLPSGQFRLALNRSASPNYFQAAGIPLLEGRTFTDRDGRGFDEEHPGEGAVIISDSMAKQFWPGANALGQEIYVYEGPINTRCRIIGIVGDALISLADHPRPTMYVPLFDGVDGDFYAVLRTKGNAAGLASALRQTLRSLDPDIPAYKIQTMAQIAGQSSEQQAFTAVLFAAFAALAISLSAVGLYGVLAYLIAQRVPEIGIRMALGANRFEVCRLILFQGLRPAFTGLVVGLVAAFAVVRVLRSLLFGVSATDALTFASVPLMLLLVAALACTLPAWHAARLDPAEALRAE
jgi:predicted permease